ncbi:MAG: pyridoxal-phosphate dependent enzyme [Chloroflexota bacterium]|nr:MAG: pyridoxal-phosphate dependent enzyme [Chloroflexota bacterium]
MYLIQCIQCNQDLSIYDLYDRCPNCGGYFVYNEPFNFEPYSIDDDQPGIWRFRHTFGLPEDIVPVSLGEGNTPLVWDVINGRSVGFKLDYLTPTGSYKDRGTSVLISLLKWNKVGSAIEDSSGNAGASFAAYTARAGIMSRVFVPSSASGPKRYQIQAYGSKLVEVPGPRSNAAEAVKIEANQGTIYASHVHQPYVLPGYATAAYEILEQLGETPGSVLAPVGQGGLLLGMARGFEALLNAGLISDQPQLVGVQSRRCAPLWERQTTGAPVLDETGETETIAEGIRIRQPLRGDQVAQSVQKSGGFFVAVEEDSIIPGRNELARLGFYVEPTSAVIWSALLESLADLKNPIVVVLTGSGLKYLPAN